MANKDFTAFMQIVLDEYQRWKCNINEENQKTTDLISMGAMGACAGIAQKISEMEDSEEPEAQETQEYSPRADQLGFGARVRIARRARGLKQSDVATACGYNTRMVSCIECGKLSRDAKSSVAVAEYLGVD